jgi:hypothetical protein
MKKLCGIRRLHLTHQVTKKNLTVIIYLQFFSIEVSSKRLRVNEEVQSFKLQESNQSRTTSAVSELLNQDKYYRMIAATYKNSQETLRRQEDMALKLNALTEFVWKPEI